ncbi:hypothetical protein D3C73_862310 [compost metagenome]
MRIHLGEQHLESNRLLLPLLQFKLVYEYDNIINHPVEAFTKRAHLVRCTLADGYFNIQLLVRCFLHAPLQDI